MPVSISISKEIMEKLSREGGLEKALELLKSRDPSETPLPPKLPRETALDMNAVRTRLEILEKQGITLETVSGKIPITDPAVYRGNIENFVGLAQVPIGIIGPLRINGVHAHGDFYVPLATSEGALVASYNRGAKVISLSGGSSVACLTERVSRAPGFVFSNLGEAGKFLLWIVPRFEEFRQQAGTTTRHGRLEDMKITVEGNHVYINFEYTTGDAAGQNMVTIATDAVCRYIEANCPVKPKHWFVESNLSGDKKATAMSYLYVRGKKVVAEVLIPKEIFTRLLHTTPEKAMEYWKMSFVGGVQAGSIGVQGHYANALAALFIACGQDAACVAEASVGITRMDMTEEGSLYMSVSLPNMIVGTIGGGTDLPTQRECLRMLGCAGEGTSRKFAEICAATVLAGEISIIGALVAGQFAGAHEAYGRKRKKTAG